MGLAGTILSCRYVLDEPVGTGGYGKVWRATDTVLARPVAVKLLHEAYAHHPQALTRFRAEARHAAAMSHQNIARVYDFGDATEEQPPYLVMELIDGRSLADILTDGPLSAARSMDVVAQAAAGLQAAHAAGLIHRDIKPANLLLAPGGIVKITDFGIAHAAGSVSVTTTGELIGTPGYLAPERIAGAETTAASDLYALGVVAYECVGGAPPFTGPALAVAMSHRDQPLPPLPSSVPPAVCALVMHLTAKDPAYRPGSAAEVAHRAGLLRDGLDDSGGAEQHSWPGVPVAMPDERPGRVSPTAAFRSHTGGMRIRGRAALALTALVLAGFTGLVLASTTGSESGQHPVSVPSAAASASPARSSVVVQTSSPSAASRPATVTEDQQRAVGSQETVTSSQPSRKKSHGRALGHNAAHGHGKGRG